MRSMASPPRTLQRLEARLLLLGWANLQFGFRSNKELFDALKDAEEGYHPDGRSHVDQCSGAGSSAPFPPATWPATTTTSAAT